MDPELQLLALRLGEVAVRNTATIVAGQVSAALSRNKAEDKIVELRGVIDELQNDRAELVQIARAFEDELVAQRISEADIVYISNTLIPKVENLLSMSAPDGETTAEMEQILSVVRELLSAETIRILQVLGFNFRRAVGGPLTNLLSDLIASKAPSGERDARLGRREELYLRIALDPDASNRWETITGQS